METFSFSPQNLESVTISPPRCSLEHFNFFSAPTSPTRKALKVAAFSTEPGTPATYEDANSNFDEFEFDTSRRFDVDFGECCAEKGWMDEQNMGKKTVLGHGMAFADELFSDGKVVAPLKPPPRFQYLDSGKFGRQSSAISLPRSPNGGLRLPFQRRSLWNDDFDPFMVALENVREVVGEGRLSPGKNHRRARSMSLMWATSPLSSPNMWAVKSPIKLSEPKGVVFARQARLVKMGQDNIKRPVSLGPINSSIEIRKSEMSCTRKSKRQRIKKLLFSSSSIGKKGIKEKPREDPRPNATTETRPTLTRKSSIKCMPMTQYNEEKRVSEVTKLTLAQYRPKLWLCVGLGANYAQQ